MNESYKLNTLALAKHHRKYCEGENCTISLHVLMMMANNAGVVFSKEEEKEFL